MTANEFQLALKEFVARRGRPSMIISDNAKTFQATSKWLKYLKQDDGLFNYLGQQNITWRFNLSRAPWWGGFFERLVGIMKRSLSKSVGQSLLTYDEFKETLLDVECFMNDRPLIYVGDECVQPVLTPNLLIRDSPGQFMEEDIDKLNYTDEDVIVTKRMNYLRRTREQLRKRWQQEYLHALQERHTRNGDQNQLIPRSGSVVLITDSMNDKKPKWTLGKVIEKIYGKDKVVRGLRVKCGSGYTVDRPLQLVRNLEIPSHTDTEQVDKETDAFPTQHKNSTTQSGGATKSDPPLSNQYHRQAKANAVDRMTGLALNDFEEE